MADDKSKRGKQDRARVSASEPYEVNYFARKHGLSKDQALKIIKETKGGQMTVESIPMDEMQAADRWGTEFFKLISPALTPNDPPP